MDQKHNAKNQSIRGVCLRDVQALTSLCSVYKLRDSGKKILGEASRSGRLAAIRKVITGISAAISKTLGRYPDRTGDSPVHTTIKLASSCDEKVTFDDTDYDDSSNSSEDCPVDKIERFFEQGYDVNAVNGCNETPLHYAAKAKELSYFNSRARRPETIELMDIVGLLVNYGADLNARDDKGQSPLHVAVQVGHAETVELLLNQGADWEAITNDGLTSLHFAIEFGHLAILQLLLRHRPDVHAEVNQNCLATAVNQLSENSKGVVDALLEYGFTVGPTDVESSNFFHRAVDGGYLNIVEELVNLGADIHAAYCEDTPDTDFRKGDTPLHSAILMNQADVVKFLVTRGVDMYISNQRGDKPMDYAARFDQTGKSTEILLANGARISNYASTVRLAVEEGCTETVQLLSQYPNATNIVDFVFNSDTDRGRTLLHIAALCGHPQTACLLLNKGANINAVTNKKQTPLHFAVFSGHKYGVVKLLLERGATVNAKDNNNLTPLLVACEKSSAEVVKILLEYGADIYARNNYGKTALHIASERKNVRVVKFLLNYGIDVNIADRKKKTALDLARIQIDCNDPKSTKLTRQTINLLRTYLFKMVIANMYVSNENKKAVNSTGHRFKKNIEEFCKTEIRRMKRKKIKRTTISFHDILLISTSSLEQIMRDDKVKQGLQTYAYKKFPMYGSLIKFKLKEAEDRKGLLQQWRGHFCGIGTEHVRLTNYCIEEIFSYLSNADIKVFIDECSSIKLP